MNGEYVRFAWRTFVFVGLIVVNALLPVQAKEGNCENCVELGGSHFCFEVAMGEGWTFCNPDGDHCDYAGEPCTRNMD